MTRGLGKEAEYTWTGCVRRGRKGGGGVERLRQDPGGAAESVSVPPLLPHPAGVRWLLPGRKALGRSWGSVCEVWLKDSCADHWQGRAGSWVGAVMGRVQGAGHARWPGAGELRPETSRLGASAWLERVFQGTRRLGRERNKTWEWTWRKWNVWCWLLRKSITRQVHWTLVKRFATNFFLFLGNFFFFSSRGKGIRLKNWWLFVQAPVIVV